MKNIRWKCTNVKVGNLTFKNPLILASGTFGWGDKFIEVANKMGGIVTKGLTVKPRQGNPPPRIYETSAGILNSVGLENPGVEKFCKEILPRLKPLKTNLIVNIAGNSVQEYKTLAEELYQDLIAGIEINLSCPNIETKKLIGQNPKMTYKVVKTVRDVSKKFLITKLTANFIDPLLTAQAAVEAGTDAVCLINTLYGIAFDYKTGKPILGGISGGLSGPAIKPFALYCVWHVSQKLKVPIIGCGGITTGKDVLEYLSAGSVLVEIGSANLRNPYVGLEILKEIDIMSPYKS
ncbi:MAG: dihydroorotate dehydrogenase [candidate division WOR-3 bacterium]|nr:dihydroorotate dehydrogenase [candidate division WOR-3 bacterium]